MTLKSHCYNLKTRCQRRILRSYWSSTMKKQVKIFMVASMGTESSLTTLVGMQDLSMGMQYSSPQVESYNVDDGAGTPGISGLDDLWHEMSLAMECSKDVMESDEPSLVQNGEECNHSLVLQEDLGLVCHFAG